MSCNVNVNQMGCEWLDAGSLRNIICTSSVSLVYLLTEELSASLASTRLTAAESR